MRQAAPRAQAVADTQAPTGVPGVPAAADVPAPAGVPAVPAPAGVPGVPAVAAVPAPADVPAVPAPTEAPAAKTTRGPHTATPKRTSAKRLLVIAVCAALLAAGYLAYTTFFGRGDDEAVPGLHVNGNQSSQVSGDPGNRPSPARSTAPSAVKATPPVSPVGTITLPQRVVSCGQLS